MRIVPTLPRLATTTTLATAAVITTAVGLATPAQATPPQGATAETLVELELELAPSLQAPFPDETESALRRIVIEPGGSTGWHRHNGRVQGLVAAGTLTRVFADCSRAVSPAGSWVTEVPGSDHIGLNLGPDPVVLLVTYVMEDDEPYSEDVPAHCE